MDQQLKNPSVSIRSGGPPLCRNSQWCDIGSDDPMPGQIRMLFRNSSVDGGSSGFAGTANIPEIMIKDSRKTTGNLQVAGLVPMKEHAMRMMVILCIIIPLLAFGQNHIQRQVIASGGGQVKSGVLSLTGTVGQPVVGRTGDSGHRMKAGFWCMPVVSPINAVPIAGEQSVEFQLEQNFPNPFNPATTIAFSVRESCRVVLNIHDLLGRIVATPVERRFEAGSYSIPFDASHLPSGVYMARIRMGGFTAVEKMVKVQ
jgi:hypothetical protein